MLFFVREDSRVWASWNHSFDIPATWDHILCFHTLSLSSSELTVGSGLAWWLLDHKYSPSWVPSGLTGLQRRAAIADDYDSLVYWDGRKYSWSHSLWGPAPMAPTSQSQLLLHYESTCSVELSGITLTFQCHLASSTLQCSDWLRSQPSRSHWLPKDRDKTELFWCNPNP